MSTKPVRVFVAISGRSHHRLTVLLGESGATAGGSDGGLDCSGDSARHGDPLM